MARNKKHEMHGLYGCKLYKTWANMINRCTNPNIPRYKCYGARGIAVCEEWRNSFAAFHSWAIGNGYSEGLTLDRIDNDGNYCPENCRWISNREQQFNRSNNRRLTFNGETLTVKEWADKIGMHPRTLGCRLDLGWSVEDALTKPVNRKRVSA